jgi:protocatechuate 3,4-dioxygenase beta subunit
VDDAPVGRLLTRRETVLLLGAAGAYGLLWASGCRSRSDASGTNVGSGSLDCAVKPELTEGPYYVDEGLTRSDIRPDSASGAVQAGIPLVLTLNVSRIRSGACTPLAGAVVDVWHCNAVGVYSDVRDPGFNTIGQDWLRGNQTTDASGVATFTTIMPGWYQGRATHIHFKIRSAAGGGATHEFTSQLFFPEDFLPGIYTGREPYSKKGDAGRLHNEDDRIYGEGGSQLMLAPESSGDGYAARFSIGIQADA